ncbi:disease resistance protein RPV1-like [Syzygium oleosum]|uniref:disease resistance protein RPV1-like n=1 Tax=Syzygium oleosum TaxID=219896 RepID=UPI0024B8FDE7|nr:disease resistance protein RPV1-like [Syzygium oleosum]
MKRKISSCSIDSEREREATAPNSSVRKLGLVSSPPSPSPLSLPSPSPRPPPPSLPPPPPPPSLPPSSSRPPSSISTSSRNNYEVFLSFRGPDTRKGFADCLYTSLINARIIVFRDDNELDPGDNIPDALVQSIKQSKISIPIISKDYASSKSCLMELAQMVECNEADAQLIVPIFYDIDPADLKYQRGCVGESFSKHESRGIDREVIKKWKEALEKITVTKGHDLRNTEIGHGALIKKVVSDILEWLKKNDLDVTDGLVGMEPRVREVMKTLGVIYVNEQATGVYDKDVRVLGICGMPGIGKTTLAKVVYNKIHSLFQRCSFLSNIHENVAFNGLMGLQEQLISDLRRQEFTRLETLDKKTEAIKISLRGMKVLILLDDVHHFDQIKHLVGDLSWFGPGSRILMTVGNSNVLDGYGNGVAYKYEVGEMGPPQALKLFHMHAFRECTREEEDEYDSLSKDIVGIIGGIPFAIEVTASFLHKNKGGRRIWQHTLDTLRRRPEDKVQKVIQLSYDSLHEETQEIFLDIACFFIGTDHKIPPYMWCACNYDPRGIMILCDMGLVKIGENSELLMHNQLREFGRETVRRQDPHEPRNRNRLWNHVDALSTLNGEQSLSSVEALGLTFDEGQSECFRCERFSHLGRLRFLRLDRATVGGSSWDVFGYLGRLRLQILDPATVGGSSQNVISNLRWLDWQGCSQISELLIFHLEKLVILDLSRSKVTGGSQVWGQILKKAKELKVLDLSSCRDLNAFPDFRASMYLERLVLERCSALSQIGPLIGNLKNLVSLNLKFCTFVSALPQELCHMKDLEELLIDGTAIKRIDFELASMKKLKILSACQCGSLAHVSPSIGHLESLEHLRLDGAAIERLPESIKSLKKLRRLLLGNCQNLLELPGSIGNLESLEVMDLSSTKIASLPRSVKHLKNLKVLKMENTHLEKFPKDIKNLEKLEEIDLSKCWNLKAWIVWDIRGLSSLKILNLASTKISGLPWTLPLLSDLQQLDLSECDQLWDLQRLPSSLSILRWGSKKMWTVPDLSFLRNLKELYLSDNFDPTDPMKNSSSEPPEIGWLTRLANLEILELCLSNITKLPEHFNKLQLRKLVLHHAKLRDLRELPSSLSVLCLQRCVIQCSQFSTVRSLSELELENCLLAATVSLDNLRRLELLKISHCYVRTLDGLENLPRFRRLTLDACPSLTGLPDQTNRTFEIDGYSFPEEQIVGTYVART